MNNESKKMNGLVKFVLCFMVLLVAGLCGLIVSVTVEHFFISSMTDVHVLFSMAVGILAAKDIYNRY